MKLWITPLLLSLAALTAHAGGTATWEMNNYADFVQGRFAGISLNRDGRLRLAPKLDTLFSSDQPVIWSVAQSKDGTLYALAVLDVNGIMKSLEDAKELNSRIRDYVRANARRAFNDLDRELSKRSARGR